MKSRAEVHTILTIALLDVIVSESKAETIDLNEIAHQLCDRILGDGEKVQVNEVREPQTTL